MANWNFSDVWPVVHPLSPKVQVPDGWTWGFPSTEDTSAGPVHEPVTRPLVFISVEGTGSVAPLLRRIDRVCVCPELASELAGAYPTFLSKSDHKCVVVSMAPRVHPTVATREGIPTSFLSDEATVPNLLTRLRAQLSTVLAWWEEAHTKIREVSWRYERTHRPCGFLEAAAYLRLCTRHRVSVEFLGHKGFYLTTDEVAYSQLVALSEREHQDRTGMLVLQPLREVLASEVPPRARRKAEIASFVRELQNRCRLCVIRKHGGPFLTDTLKMAKALSGYWGGVMTGNGSTACDCRGFLQDWDPPRQSAGVSPKTIADIDKGRCANGIAAHACDFLPGVGWHVSRGVPTDVVGICPTNTAYVTDNVVLRGGSGMLVTGYHELHPEATGGT